MQFRTIGIMLLGAMVLPAPGVAQTTPAPSAVTRTVVAATKLPNLTGAPLHFKAVSVTLQPGEKSSVSAADGILYQISGSTEVSLDSETKMLNAGEGRFIANGKRARSELPISCPFDFVAALMPRTTAGPRISATIGTDHSCVKSPGLSPSALTTASGRGPHASTLSFGAMIAATIAAAFAGSPSATK